jgi:hypothetical protein
MNEVILSGSKLVPLAAVGQPLASPLRDVTMTGHTRDIQSMKQGRFIMYAWLHHFREQRDDERTTGSVGKWESCN